MAFVRVSQEQHPVEYGTQARACSQQYGWLFGPVVWRVRNADNHYIYTVQDKRSGNTTDVADFQLEVEQK